MYIYLQQIKGRTNAPTSSSQGKNTGCPLKKEEATQKIPNTNPNLNNPGKTRRSPYRASFNKTMNHKHGHPNQTGKNHTNVKQTNNQEFSSTLKFVILYLGVWCPVAFDA